MTPTLANRGAMFDRNSEDRTRVRDPLANRGAMFDGNSEDRTRVRGWGTPVALGVGG